MRHEDAILPWHPFLDHRHELYELRTQLLGSNRLGRVFQGPVLQAWQLILCQNRGLHFLPSIFLGNLELH